MKIQQILIRNREKESKERKRKRMKKNERRKTKIKQFKKRRGYNGGREAGTEGGRGREKGTIFLYRFLN